MNRLFLVIISLNLLLSCEKTEEPSQTALEFYLLKDYQTYDHVKIDENTAVISDSVLIQYDSIISYNKSTYAFKITDSTINYDSREFSPILGKAFAVTIDKNIIYTGYFWSGYRSLGCAPCTEIINDDESERNGRWKGTCKQGGECGIHTRV